MKKALILSFFLSCVCLDAQVALDSLSRVVYEYPVNDVWGFVQNGREYAVGMTRFGTSFVDVTNPIDPVQVHWQDGVESNWRDGKHFGNYVYVTNESSGGMRVYDLTNFPDALTYTDWEGGDFQGTFNVLDEAHNVFIDENGICYVIGYNYPALIGGVMMLDLNVDPVDPPIVGIYDDGYVHDAFVRNDTMWTAEYFNGHFAVVDITDKANPTILAIQNSPANKAHNIWLSDDSQYAFVSDETPGGTVSSWDVSDLTDIQLLDEYYSSHPIQSTPHNAFVKGNYLYISHYTDGVVVLDISDPYNLTEVAHYDTAPIVQGSSYSGCWGVYPYLPSGTILASDRQEGLYMLGDATANPPVFEVSLKVLLQGAHISTGEMRTTLLDEGHLPIRHTYDSAPYNFSYLNLIENLPTNMVDWILVEARSGTPVLSGSKATTTVETKLGLLLSDGTIVNPYQHTPLRFSNLVEGEEYHFCIRHRNHLDVLTATPMVATKASVMTYDLTTAVTQAWGIDQLIEVESGYAMMHGGEFSQDGVIQITDYDAWQYNPAQLDVYETTDGNLDGVIQVTDYDLWFSNKAKLGTVEIDF